MPQKEFCQWMAYYSLEPFGARRDNLHAGIVAAAIANTNRGKGTKALSAVDFMLKDEAEIKQKNIANFAAGIRALAKPKS